MNGSLEVFERVFESISGSEERSIRQDVIDRQTFEIAALVHKARSLGHSETSIGPHYCLDVLRALNNFCVVTPFYKDKKLRGYNLEW